MSTITYRDFDGDLDALSKLARDSWTQAYGTALWPDLYNPLLTGHYFSDIDDSRYLVGAYEGAKLVAFIANLPRTYRLNDRRYKGVLSCMLVGHKDFQRRGIALGLIDECLKRNRDVGCDLSLMYFEDQQKTAELIRRHLLKHHRIEPVRKLRPLVRIIDFEKVSAASRLGWLKRTLLKSIGAHLPPRIRDVDGLVRPYRDEDLMSVKQLVDKVPDRDCLVRVFDERALSRKLKTNGVAASLVYEKAGVVKGFVNLSFVEMTGRHKNLWAWMDYLFWEGLLDKEKHALLASAWILARRKGSIALLEWSKGYYSQGLLYRSRFVTYPRYLQLHAWVFHPELSVRNVEKVFEQQL